MKDITFEQLVLLAAIVLACIGAYNSIMTARKNHREEKMQRESPVTRLAERVDKHDSMLATDKRRLDEMDGRIEKIETQSTIILRGVRSLLSHEVSGNSVDKLQKSLQEIDEYLIERK